MTRMRKGMGTTEVERMLQDPLRWRGCFSDNTLDSSIIDSELYIGPLASCWHLLNTKTKCGIYFPGDLLQWELRKSVNFL